MDRNRGFHLPKTRKIMYAYFWDRTLEATALLSGFTDGASLEKMGRLPDASAS